MISKEWFKSHVETICIIILICVVDLLIISTNLFDCLLSDELEFLHMGLERPFWFLYSGFNNKYYRPIPLLLLQSLYYVFGLNPLPYHLVSLALLISNHVLIYLIARMVSKSRLTPFLSVMGGILCASFYYEVIFWISTYFDLIFTAFCLAATYFFLKSRIKKERPALNFYLAVIFTTVGFLAKESALFMAVAFAIYEIARYDFRDTSKVFSNFKLLIKKNLCYLAFIPLLALFLLNRFVINPRLSSTLTMFTDPITLGFIGIGLIMAYICYEIFQRRLQDPIKQFFIISTAVFAFQYIFHTNSRILFLPLLFLPIVILLFFDRFDYSLFAWLKKVKHIRIRRVYLSVILISGLITGSTVFMLCHKTAYNQMSRTTLNMLDYLDEIPDIETKEIYLINLPDYTTFYWGVLDLYFEHGMFLYFGKTCNITQYFVYGNNTPAFDMWHRDFKKVMGLYFRAEDLSIPAFDNLTNTTLNPNNQVYVYEPLTMSLRNVTNIPYYSW
ncbi:MAG: glycosyltransferase family 39 protein [Candidatus Helarchaeota archaeon]